MRQLGGNARAQEFFESQPDYKPGMAIREKYNTRAAALYREKVRFSSSSTANCPAGGLTPTPIASSAVRGPHVDRTARIGCARIVVAEHLGQRLVRSSCGHEFLVVAQQWQPQRRRR